ncbi:MAG: zinc ribbon domain-containing protein [Dehalococcoidia bacterium]
MFCEECGTEIPEGSKYCPECGARLAESPPAQEGGIGCYACGQTAVGQCPGCGRFYCREHGEEGLCALCAAGRMRKHTWIAAVLGALPGFMFGFYTGYWFWNDNANVWFGLGAFGAIVTGYIGFRYASQFGTLGLAIASLALTVGSCWTYYFPGSTIATALRKGRSEAEAWRRIWTNLPLGWGITFLVAVGALWLFRRREK